MKKTEEVWFLNNEDAKIFINENIVNVRKMKVLPGEGVNTEYFSSNYKKEFLSEKKFTFLMSTRLLKSKGVAIYADAARILKKKNYQLNFELSGFFEIYNKDSITEEEF